MHEPTKQLDAAGQQSSFDQRGKGHWIRKSELTRIARRADTPTDVEPHVVKVLHQPLSQRSDAGLDRRFVQDHQIDVRIRRDISATVAAVGSKGNMPSQSVIAIFAQIGQGLFDQVEQNTIDQIGHLSAKLNPRQTGKMLLAKCLAPRDNLLFGGDERRSNGGGSRHSKQRENNS